MEALAEEAGKVFRKRKVKYLGFGEDIEKWST